MPLRGRMDEIGAMAWYNIQSLPREPTFEHTVPTDAIRSDHLRQQVGQLPHADSEHALFQSLSRASDARRAAQRISQSWECRSRVRLHGGLRDSTQCGSRDCRSGQRVNRIKDANTCDRWCGLYRQCDDGRAHRARARRDGVRQPRAWPSRCGVTRVDVCRRRSQRHADRRGRR